MKDKHTETNITHDIFKDKQMETNITPSHMKLSKTDRQRPTSHVILSLHSNNKQEKESEMRCNLHICGGCLNVLGLHSAIIHCFYSVLMDHSSQNMCWKLEGRLCAWWGQNDTCTLWTSDWRTPNVHHSSSSRMSAPGLVERHPKHFSLWVSMLRGTLNISLHGSLCRATLLCPNMSA